jgi:DNA-binding NtrC family response regulator
VLDDRVSSAHARIERAGGGWQLVDLGSTNGSRVNGRAVEAATMLGDGDLIEIGHTFLRYRASMATPFNAPGDVDGADLHDLVRAFRTLVPSFTRDLETLARVARSSVSVLLLGETGTGKEVLASAIHGHSQRKGPFVAVNCGALPPTLVESLLFGHRRGAFSGATQDELGFVRAADGGTLFLDEIADLGAPAQAAMLRVLQEREVTPLGATRPVSVDVRVIAATHRPLHSLVASGAFRQDLLARVADFTHVIPPLRERIDDLGVLVAALLRKVAGEQATRMSLSAAAVRAMVEHPWPLNVRELEQRLKTAAVLAIDGKIELDHLWKDAGPGHGDRRSSAPAVLRPALSPEDQALRADLVAKLEAHSGNVTHVGEAMGKSRTQIQRWLRRLGIDAERFRR